MLGDIPNRRCPDPNVFDLLLNSGADWNTRLRMADRLDLFRQGAKMCLNVE